MIQLLLFLLLIFNQFTFGNNTIWYDFSTFNQEEIDEIRDAQEPYSYFESEVLSQDLPFIEKNMRDHISCQNLQLMCQHIARGKSIIPTRIIESALQEAAAGLESDKIEFPIEVLEQLVNNLEDYYAQFSTGSFTIHTIDSDDSNPATRNRKEKKLCSLKVKRKLVTCCLAVHDNALICGNLTVNGNELVKGNLTVLGTLTAIINFIVSGCQPGPLTIGTSNATSLTFVTQCIERMTIDANGGVTIATPSGGEVGLTINGGGETITAGDLLISAGNAILPAATPGAATTVSKGLLELGGTNASATNINIFEAATRNLFAGNYTTVPNVSGTDNISIGTTANNTLTTANNTIAIGNTALATATDGIAIGDTANSTFAQTIVLGSKDSTSTGVAPTAGALNAIAIGSASGTNAGAVSNGISSIALGGAGPLFAGASATANRSIAIGLNATASAIFTIALGSASGTAGGTGPRATNSNAIAIGSGNTTMTAPIASGISSIAIGSADSLGTFAGASATGNRSIAIGINANTNSSGAISIGSASGTAGGNAPVASNISAIAIGSASLTRAGAIASGISAIAIGGADGASAVVSNFPGAVASGNRSIAIGVNAMATSDGTVAVGSASGAGSSAAIANNTNAVAIGAANGVTNGATASGLAAVAIGGARAGVAGATASGDRSVAIGNGASTATTDAILLGNTGVTAVRVAIGITVPVAKLDIVGVNGTPVIRFDQVNTAIGNAPVWLNPSTSVVAGTPIHYNASNQLFGFTSSKRYKQNIRSINSESDVIYQLNPVLYDPQDGYGEGRDIPGFIAEDVYDVAPHLAILNGNNQPENVAYNSLHALAIKEIQKHQQQIEAQNILITDQATIINNLLMIVEQLQTKLNLLEKNRLAAQNYHVID